MSHFAVLVIGDNVEQQLARYHEFECTGINDQYVQDVDVTKEIAAEIAAGSPLDDALSNHGLHDRIVASEADVQKVGEDAPHQYGYAIVQNGHLIKAVDRTNPDSKWDWWMVGGRFSGFLRAKPDANSKTAGEPTAPRKGKPGVMGTEFDATGVDVALKRDIDFEAMRSAAGVEAADSWDKAAQAKVSAGLTENTTWETWGAVGERHPSDIDGARKAYNAQPAVDAIKKAFKDHFFLEPDQFLVSRDAYVQKARDHAIVPYAIVKDGQWIAQGEMGWFGISDDKVDLADWNRKVNEMLDDLPEDTLITVVDCHI